MPAKHSRRTQQSFTHTGVCTLACESSLSRKSAQAATEVSQAYHHAASAKHLHTSLPHSRYHHTGAVLDRSAAAHYELLDDGGEESTYHELQARLLPLAPLAACYR